MPKLIKLENIGIEEKAHSHPNKPHALYCATCGEALTEAVITTSYVCEGCRHLNDPTNKYCTFCGGIIEGGTPRTEHYYSGKMNDEHFEAVKTIIKSKKGG